MALTRLQLPAVWPPRLASLTHGAPNSGGEPIEQNDNEQEFIMRIKVLLAGAAIAAAALTMTACSAQTTTPSTRTASPSSSSAPAATTKSTGTFAGLNDKKVSGSVTINGATLSLSGFSSDQGPDLHLYLTNGTTEADVTSGTQIDVVAWDKATQTFTLPSGVDASKFTYLIVHCDKAKAAFGAAKLSNS